MARLLCLLGVVFASVLHSPAHAAPYPTRTVEIIVSYGAGGSTDFVARAVAQKLSERLGQPFVVLNRPGASGTIGINTAMRAKPDGYTLYVGYTSETVVGPQISKTATYSAVDDFEPIAITGLVPVVLIVSKNVKADNLKDFIAEVRANPGKYTYGGSVGSPPHIMGAWMNKVRGLDVRHVPHRGGMQGVTDMVGGHIDMFYGGDRGGEACDRFWLGQTACGDRRRALHSATERADLPGGRRAGVRSGELDCHAGPEGHASRYCRPPQSRNIARDRRSENACGIGGKQGVESSQTPGRTGVSDQRAGQVRPLQCANSTSGWVSDDNPVRPFPLRAAARTD